MSLKEQLERHGATPGKLALIGVLATVLAIVVFRQLPSTEEPSVQMVSTTQLSDEPEAQAAAKRESNGAAAQEDAPSWPELKLEETLANNPFVPPAWATLPELSGQSEDSTPGLLAQLQHQGVSIVIIGDRQKSATVGEKKVRVGDVLEGYQVTDITTEGVVLNKTDSD